jgi:hypothetical protein
VTRLENDEVARERWERSERGARKKRWRKSKTRLYLRRRDGSEDLKKEELGEMEDRRGKSDKDRYEWE